MDTKMTDKLPTLEELRAEIDRIDTIMHDLIMERTMVVDAVRQVKEGERVKIRPGREAEMLYRLSARHKGRFPKQALFRIWRELISGTLTIEGPFCLAIQTPDGKTGYIDLARDHYGGYSEISTHGSSRDVIDAVATDQAAIGILPFPTQDTTDDWWHNLPPSGSDSGGIKIIARLPFFGRSNAPGGNLDALVISYAEPVKAGRDLSLFGFSTSCETSTPSIIDAFKQNDMDIRTRTVSPSKGNKDCMVLVEVEGFHDGTGLKLPNIIRNIAWLGSYSSPIEDDELFGDPTETQK